MLIYSPYLLSRISIKISANIFQIVIEESSVYICINNVNMEFIVKMKNASMIILILNNEKKY